jgi:hypothetical protein
MNTLSQLREAFQSVKRAASRGSIKEGPNFINEPTIAHPLSAVATNTLHMSDMHIQQH